MRAMGGGDDGRWRQRQEGQNSVKQSVSQTPLSGKEKRSGVEKMKKGEKQRLGMCVCVCVYVCVSATTNRSLA